MTYFKTGYCWLGLLLLLVSYLPLLFADKAAVKRLINFSFISKKGKWISFVISLCYIAFILIPFFIKRTDSIIISIIGYILFGFGVVCTLVGYGNYFSSKPDETITKGLYRFSRNAIYVSTLFMMAGEVVLCRSLVLGVLLAVHIVLQHYVILEEERFCEQTYGESYLAYKKRTPRYFLFF